MSASDASATPVTFHPGFSATASSVPSRVLTHRVDPLRLTTLPRTRTSSVWAEWTSGIPRNATNTTALKAVKLDRMLIAAPGRRQPADPPIPIAATRFTIAAPPTRGFLPRRLSNAGPASSPARLQRVGVRNPSRIRDVRSLAAGVRVGSNSGASSGTTSARQTVSR